MATSTSQPAAPRRPWYRLHASTWAVAGSVLALFVILAVPAYREIPREPESPSAVRGWPLVIVEQNVPATTRQWISNHVSTLVAEDPERPQWLLSYWWLYDGTIQENTFSFWALVVDAALALVTAGVVATAFERRRRSGRSLWQFHFIELFSAVLAAAVCLAWYANAKAGLRDEQAAEQAWRAHYGEYEGPFATQNYVGPHWLLRLLGEGVGENFARTINVEYSAYFGEDIGSLVQELPRFHYLDQLKLTDCQNVGPVFASVSSSAPLSECSLVRSKITLAGLRELHRHPGVRNLTFERCHIDANALSALVGLPRLESLFIDAEELGDGNFRAIGRLVGLRKLWIHSDDLNDERLGQLSKLTSLEELNLYDNAITDASIPHLRSFTRLESLYLWSTQVSPQGIAELQKILPHAKIFGPDSADK